MKRYLDAVPPLPSDQGGNSVDMPTYAELPALPDAPTLAYIAGLIDGDGNIFIRKRLGQGGGVPGCFGRY